MLCGFAWLRRLDDAVYEFVSLLCEEGLAEVLEMRGDSFAPVRIVDDAIGGGIIGSNGGATGAWFSSVEFEGMDGGFMKIIRNTFDVFNFKLDRHDTFPLFKF
jgi:hypothetical protein